MSVIDHERPDDYAAAIENNRTAALAWLNTALKRIERDVFLNPEVMSEYEESFPMRNGSRLNVIVAFDPPEE